MAKSIKLAFVGDIMCGDSFSLIGQGAATMIDRYGQAFLQQEIVDVFKSHDMVMGNVECVLSDVGRKERNLRRLHMRGRSRTANLLSEWGLTIANLANNHILEQGQEAALDTVKNLQAAGIQVIGAGAGNRMERDIDVLTLDVKGLRVGLLGLCFRQEKYAYDGGINKSEAVSHIRKCRVDHDLVIVSVHWGNELIDYPSLEQRELAEQFQQAGADIIIGHHPHVVQGLDRIESSLVVYSLGNFIFDGFSPMTGWAYILSLVIEDSKIVKIETIPFVRSDDFRPILTTGQQKEDLLKEIQRRNELCSGPVEDPQGYDQQYRLQVASLCQGGRKKLWLSLAKRFFTYSPVYWHQLLLRPIQRRLGKW